MSASGEIAHGSKNFAAAGSAFLSIVRFSFVLPALEAAAFGATAEAGNNMVHAEDGFAIVAKGRCNQTKGCLTKQNVELDKL